MNILLINHFPLVGSGSGVYTNNIALSLKKAGNNVAILFPTNKDFKKTEGIKYYPVYFNSDELNFNFPCFTTHPESNLNFDDLSKEQLNRYIEVFKKEMDKIIEEFKPDIIHSGHIWILSSLACNYNKKVIITAHGTDLIGHNRNDKYHNYTFDAAKRASKIITISKDNEKLVKNAFPDTKDKVVLMKNGYDPKIFYKENISREDFLKTFNITKKYNNVICFAGKLTNIKGVDTILDAAKLLDNKKICFLIAGNGELYDILINKKDELKLDNVYFIKNQPHEILRKMYSISDISLAPSRKEAFGLVAIEALACGTPVIATNIGGFPEFINKKTGIIINVDDSKALAENIKKILNKKISFDTNYIQKLIYNTYSQDLMLEDLLELYKK